MVRVFTDSRALKLQYGDAEAVEACQQGPACHNSWRGQVASSWWLPFVILEPLSWSAFLSLPPLLGGGALVGGPLVSVHLVLCPLQVITFTILATDSSENHSPAISP